MQRLKELRLSADLTQREVAEKISVTQTTVAKYERDELEPSLEILKRLCQLFECSIDYLTGFSDDLGNVTVYNTAEGYNALTGEEQKIINIIRHFTPPNADEWLSMYGELPSYMQESIYAELKGMHLGYTVSKKKKNKEN